MITKEQAEQLITLMDEYGFAEWKNGVNGEGDTQHSMELHVKLIEYIYSLTEE